MVPLSAAEAAIAINALAKDASFVDQMVEAHLRSERTIARVQSDRFAASYLSLRPRSRPDSHRVDLIESPHLAGVDRGGVRAALTLGASWSVSVGAV